MNHQKPPVDSSLLAATSPESMLIRLSGRDFHRLAASHPQLMTNIARPVRGGSGSNLKASLKPKTQQFPHILN